MSVRGTGAWRIRFKVKPPGRPSAYVAVVRQCEHCGNEFSRKPYPHDRLRFCGQACRILARPNKGQPRKLPEREEVVRLYVEDNLPITEIARRFGANHKSVLAQLRRAGVKSRRHTVPLICKIPNCGKPVQKIKHVALSTEYGRLCAAHRAEHYRLLNREGQRKRRHVNPARFKPWRYKEQEQQRQWLRQNRIILRQVRLASFNAGKLPDASQSPKKALRLVITSRG